MTSMGALVSRSSLPAVTAAALLLLVSPPVSAFTAQELWEAWPAGRFVHTAAPCLFPAALEQELQRLAERYPALSVDVVGRSVQGRPIHLVTLGHGPRKLFLWSQMHGDEPSATPALLDLADYLLAHREESDAAAILDGLTLLLVPMLNPDGAEVYTRRNAQGIDINRDALSLSTPEGRLLKRLRDEHQPILGFNLHDQNRRRTAGDSGVLATNAVLAVTGDAANTVTPGRLLAKRACAAIAEVLAPFMPGGMARYDEEWSPRAFGDNLTAWGTPVVLIESGGVPGSGSLNELSRLNFVAILSVLQDLVLDDLSGHDPEVYERLPPNELGDWSDVIVRGARIVQPGGSAPYAADLSYDVQRTDRALAGCDPGGRARSQIADVGDARFLVAAREVDAAGDLLVPPFVAGAKGWAARQWIDPALLRRLAELGVGRLRWVVSTGRIDEARRLAANLGEGSGALLEAVEEPAPLPWLNLDGPPRKPRSQRLEDIVAALAGERRRREVGELAWDALLLRLWGASGKGWPVLLPDRPASYLLLTPPEGEPLTVAPAVLKQVVIDGVEIAGGAE